MNLRSIPIPKIPTPLVGLMRGGKILKAWTDADDEYVFYLVDRHQYEAVWYHRIERGIGGRTIPPVFESWSDFHNRTYSLGYCRSLNYDGMGWGLPDWTQPDSDAAYLIRAFLMTGRPGLGLLKQQ